MYKIFFQIIVFILFYTHTYPTHGENNNHIFEGIWFTCEFSRKKSPPSDNCEMFDDEGFIVNNDLVHYLRIINSKEKNCKGKKIGQCFKKNKKEIKVKKNKLGKIKFNKNYLSISWLGCKQKYFISKKNYFYTLTPDEDKCFWATKRIFYISKFYGKVKFDND